MAKKKNNLGIRGATEPHFAQPIPASAESKFLTPHIPDKAAYHILDKLAKEGHVRPLAFPHSRGGAEPVFRLADAWGKANPKLVDQIRSAGLLVFHAAGDTGNTRSLEPQEQVSSKMETDFNEHHEYEKPLFFFHLGDVIYSFGEEKYYYDQFYEPYRNYPAPIIAIAGNHDGMIAPDSTATSLGAFWKNFCAEAPVYAAEAGGLDRTAMTQPGVYYTLDAELARILCLYSNALEDPGVISSEGGQWPEVTDVQLKFLDAALSRLKSEQYAGAVIIAVHHPPFTAGRRHGGSVRMLAEIDKACDAAGVWPHAIQSAHSHNYQRFTRRKNGLETPFIVAGNGGHGLSAMRSKPGSAIRVPSKLEGHGPHEDITFESYDDQDYGYLRVIVTKKQLRIEYHPASDGGSSKTPDDAVTVDLGSRKLVHFEPHATAELET